ncbi:hypothetical protein pipiens_003536 [Culex pipiens pipiens]|uniref:Uncharacterized protein n=1 Tax=Culex pipiens pipiens TaxID=38569 RepID=A0ABD1CWF6_CULPP
MFEKESDQEAGDPMVEVRQELHPVASGSVLIPPVAPEVNAPPPKTVTANSNVAVTSTKKESDQEAGVPMVEVRQELHPVASGSVLKPPVAPEVNAPPPKTVTADINVAVTSTKKESDQEGAPSRGFRVRLDTARGPQCGSDHNPARSGDKQGFDPGADGAAKVCGRRTAAETAASDWSHRRTGQSTPGGEIPVPVQVGTTRAFGVQGPRRRRN